MIEATLEPCATALAPAPGQFVLAAFGDGAAYRGCGEYHPFTVSGSDPGGVLRVAIKALGPCSERIQAVVPGVIVRLQGPFGTFLDERSPARPQLWVAGGIGITPFMAALRAGRCEQATTLVYVYRSAGDDAFADELAEHARSDPNFELITEETGAGAPDFERLLGRVARLDARQVYVCGPGAMVRVLEPVLERAGISGRSIHYESFDFR
jgi:predicted ferric reductase